MKTWFSITNLATAPSAEIDIFGEIGAAGSTFSDFAASLRKIPADREITVRINSQGGSVSDGNAIFSLLSERRDKVTTKIVGLAASMASVIAIAGKRTLAAANAIIMIHNPAAVVKGESKDMRDAADTLDKYGGTLVSAYVAKTGKNETDVKAAMDAATWFTAVEAMAWGLVDEVIPAVRMTAELDLTQLGTIPPEILGSLQASINTPNAHTKMSHIIKALADAKLIPSADVTEEIAVTQLATAIAEQAAVSIAAATATDELQTKLDAANATIAANIKASAEVAVEVSVKAGRIKDEPTVRAKWVESYIRDEAGTKAMIDSLPDAKAPRGVAPVVSAPAVVPVAKELTGLARVIAAFAKKEI